MSGQRSDWRERLHANPSRMEQEIAIKLQNNQITYLNRVIALDLLFCLVVAVGLLGSCSLSFSHLGTVSPDDDLPDRGLLFRLGSFAPLLEPVASLFFAGQLGPYEAVLILWRPFPVILIFRLGVRA